jgi:thiol-disulfide isomerase/thioredoxin
MKNYFIKLFLVFVSLLIGIQIFAEPDISTLKFAEFEPLLHKNTDSVYVINFWATWCIPCRREMPEFVKIQDTYKDKKVKIILVSLDFVNQIDETLIPFLIKNKVHSQVILLNDPDSNSWIDKVDRKWTGSLPATLIYNLKSRYFVEDELNYEKIKLKIDQLLKN